MINEIRASVARHQGSVVQLTADLVAIPSVNPPGRCYAACIGRIRAELDRLGLRYELIDAPAKNGEPRTNILAYAGNGERTIWLHGHYDVVPAQSETQFTPRVEGGWLHGRGSTDMKGGLASIIYAAYVARELRIPLNGRIGLCIVPDEETGGQGGAAWLDHAGVLGKGGIAMINAEPTSGVIWNASRGALTLNVTVRGKTAHVGLQHQGINAFERMLPLAAALSGLKQKVEKRTTRFAIVPPESARSILMLGGRVEGGINYNAVPSSCSFTVERRMNPEEDYETEKGELFGIFESFRRGGTELEIEILQECNASGFDSSHPVAHTLAGAVAEVTGSTPRFEMCPGTAETRWYAKRGIPSFGYGPGLLELAHGPEERVAIDDILEHTAAYLLTAARILC